MTSRHLASRSLLFAAISVFASHAFAAVQLGDHLSLSGFGTAAAVRTDTDDADYIRESQTNGATKSLDFGSDSNLGLQLNGRVNSWLSATVQTLSKRRSAIYKDTQVEWAFVKIEPVQGLAIRGGRIATPTFAVSDTRNIGYANTWVHAPNEVYGIALVDQLRGGDVTYAHDLAGGSLKLTGLAGKIYLAVDVGAGPFQIKLKDVVGANAVWENDWLTLRTGRVTGNYEIPSIGVFDDTYTFTGVGAIVNRDNWLVQGEYVTRRSDVTKMQIDSNAWYVLVGHQFGNFRPFVGYASADPQYDDPVNGKQTTTSLGVRWDFHPSFALKAQWDIVDTHGTIGQSFTNFSPSFDGKVNVIAVALDFVF